MGIHWKLHIMPLQVQVQTSPRATTMPQLPSKASDKARTETDTDLLSLPISDPSPSSVGQRLTLDPENTSLMSARASQWASSAEGRRSAALGAVASVVAASLVRKRASQSDFLTQTRIVRPRSVLCEA